MKRSLTLVILLAGAAFALFCQDEVPKELRITIEDRSGTLSDKSDWMGKTFGDADFKIRIVRQDPNVDY